MINASRSIKTLNIYHMRTNDMLQQLDAYPMMKLGMPPAPILWEYYGSFYIVPAEHVAEIMEAIKLHEKSTKKSAWDRPTISLEDATPIGYELGRVLSRRTSNEKLQTRKNDGDEGGE